MKAVHTFYHQHLKVSPTVRQATAFYFMFKASDLQCTICVTFITRSLYMLPLNYLMGLTFVIDTITVHSDQNKVLRAFEISIVLEIKAQ